MSSSAEKRAPLYVAILGWGAALIMFFPIFWMALAAF